MKTIYLDCGMGAAGDMLLAALLELHPDPAGVLSRLNNLGLPGVQFARKRVSKCGILGTAVQVTIKGEQECMSGTSTYESGHTNLGEIEAILQKVVLPEGVCDDALAVYRLLAEAESAVHCVPVEQIHFHEVGMLDAVADIVGVCLLLRELGPVMVIASPINVGMGHVRCAHGLLPVPAPATAQLLEGIPVYNNGIEGELCTPTGAALLRYFVADFAHMPKMRLAKTGYGMGEKDFPAPNCVRAMLGETDRAEDTVLELCCNLDDMTPEAIGFAMETLLEQGALDVFTTAVGMKKCRPGVLLTCLCKPEQREMMVTLLFCHTTTLGVREHLCSRSILTRTVSTVKTKYGPVRVKQASGWGIVRQKAEYDDLAKIAGEKAISLGKAAEVVEGEIKRCETKVPGATEEP